MKKRILIAAAGLLLVACGPDRASDELIVEGNVRGLKKGTLYLQQVADTTLVNLDSILVSGTGEFRLSSPVDGADIYYLYLDKADNNQLNDRIIFFAEPGTIRIDTRWDEFETAANITGSAANEKFAEYRKVQSRYHVQQLELARAMGELQRPADSAALDSLDRAGERLTLRSYLYALNFAMNNTDSYLAPFVAITEVSDANPKYLDSIYQALPPDIAASKYGKQLKELLEE
ncbi:DUF4369 domain-containing protein [Robiginitalea sp. SC105]|uniref:DUF4369 domain-containing protein n=1 Tax=Robiginitalea sp. SC105 TaxID=2762332 RepID=UPI001639FDED|nr:DUF4369 domain-containing protein [Robiginitalea sp. SC105]MBC2839159.1 DUF4369 domain-containing protein [Robiginitalea sp. SC105]